MATAPAIIDVEQPRRHADARTMTFDALIERARRLMREERRLLGITGPPGSGKSTLAAVVARALGDAAVLVPMDGFHLANDELVRLGRRNRKGAPDTFDGAGFVALLQRLRSRPPETVYCPRYERSIEEAIAGAIPVAPEVPLVIVEGNYLLLDEAPWSHVRPLLDESWYLQVNAELRIERLIERHVRFGKTRTAAEAWVRESDERNAERIGQTSGAADLLVDMGALPPLA